jgi:hypothetical protein
MELPEALTATATGGTLLGMVFGNGTVTCSFSQIRQEPDDVTLKL